MANTKKSEYQAFLASKAIVAQSRGRETDAA
jgi:hypothetical protein